MLEKRLLLVDYENIPRVDLSVMDDSYRAIVFVGASQNPPRASVNKATAHRFRRVDFQRISGVGKNALDFHIAFQLGRIFETAPETICIVVSRDKGFDPLLLHLNNNGLQCRRVESFAELTPVQVLELKTCNGPADPNAIVCGRCEKYNTIEHNGGRWCGNCGMFAVEPDPRLTPSLRLGFRESSRAPFGRSASTHVCGTCNQHSDMGDGLYDDGEWMCGGCIAQFAR